jgi:hypothetical protein
VPLRCVACGQPSLVILMRFITEAVKLFVDYTALGRH